MTPSPDSPTEQLTIRMTLALRRKIDAYRARHPVGDKPLSATRFMVEAAVEKLERETLAEKTASG